ncbi:Piso0_001736 [Millerozyma farinosa CBS 7064]|uniref:Piso0_001736 protein n=1 Tax=Pichia sorbitophila (strain ATCC MYA-4447 / BCRC 22081 / CBS 7064 / NBRC 10061 / NRRL Y-12695) TaxID=559304 RepID=G8YLK8_PICSO|nr:Piso0_001736 [Millerozyma farinosa CBS 7064]
MIRQSLKASYPKSCRRGYSSDVLSFIPNEKKFFFDSERLTKEENRAAIPKRPDYNHLPKYHHEIVCPDEIADILISADPRNVLVTGLAKDSPFFGRKNHKLVRKNPTKDAEHVKFYFATTGIKWLELFNEEIHALVNLEDVDPPLSYSDRFINGIISTKHEELSILAEFDNFRKPQDFELFFSSIKKDALKPEIQGHVVNHFPRYLLELEAVKQNTGSLLVVLDFLTESLKSLPLQSVIPVVSQVADIIYNSKVVDIKPRVRAFENFLMKAELVNPRVTEQLHPHVLDKLAYLYTFTSESNKALNAIQILVNRHRVSPSDETFSSFLETYNDGLKSRGLVTAEETKTCVLRELNELKPVFFHENLDWKVLSFLMNSVVSNELEFESIVNLICKRGKRTSIAFSEVLEILNKMFEIQETQSLSPLQKRLQFFQLLRRLKEDKLIDVHQAKQLIEKYDSSF